MAALQATQVGLRPGASGRAACACALARRPAASLTCPHAPPQRASCLRRAGRHSHFSPFSGAPHTAALRKQQRSVIVAAAEVRPMKGGWAWAGAPAALAWARLLPVSLGPGSPWPAWADAYDAVGACQTSGTRGGRAMGAAVRGAGGGAAARRVPPPPLPLAIDRRSNARTASSEPVRRRRRSRSAPCAHRRRCRRPHRACSPAAAMCTTRTCSARWPTR